MTKPRDDRGRQKGAVPKAEGQHGDKTHRKFLEQLHGGPSGEERQATSSAADPEHEGKGEHRLVEGRQQHDDAELQSEKTRLSRDIEHHDHDREEFQVRGGTENHPRDVSHSGPRKGRKGGGARH